MIAPRPVLEARIQAALKATPSRIPCLLGPNGSGRTTTLLQLRDQIGLGACQYLNVEQCATTPERFLAALRAGSPFPDGPASGPPGAVSTRSAYDQVLTAFSSHTGAGELTYLLDEVLELRTFESFPGLRNALHEFVAALTRSRHRFVLSTRYVSRAHRILRDAASRFEVIHVPPLSAAEVRESLPASSEQRVEEEVSEMARAVHALTDGRPAYVQALGEALASMDEGRGPDPVNALAGVLSPGGSLHMACRLTYELRLQRARGYGALKAILDVLAEEEPLTLTEIAQRLHRTPGSTKDYLSWLEDVDLIAVRQKRYSFTDPLLRLWVRLNCHPVPLPFGKLAREVHRYAMARLPHGGSESPRVARGDRIASESELSRSWGLIEID